MYACICVYAFSRPFSLSLRYVLWIHVFIIAALGLDLGTAIESCALSLRAASSVVVAIVAIMVAVVVMGRPFWPT